jgi:N-methylhydantoinase B
MVIHVPDGDYAPLPPVTIAVQAGRFRYPPQGIFGGRASARARFLHNDQAGDPSGLTFCNPGDVVEFYSAGGGGYGNPLERDPQEVKRDVMLGYVSIKKAREDYGVVIDHANLNVDQVETQKLRSSRAVDTDD